MLDNFIQTLPPPETAAEIAKPEITDVESTEDYARVALEPLVPGFAQTIGNPIRRFLLSSISGAAITRVKIEDVVHEYTAIPGVKEEVMDLLLNIKRIRIRPHSDRTGKMRLDVESEGRICAGDIATSPDFEITNPELHLATLDSSEASLSIEFTVESGYGYRPATQAEGSSGLQVGELPVDAVFNPVRKVNYFRETIPTGPYRGKEKLVLEVWTDGTISPLDAIRESANSLVDHFFEFKNLVGDETRVSGRPSLNLSPEIYQTPIERLDLSQRTLNCLKRAHITRVGEVLQMTDDELLKIRNFGEKSLTELRERLAEQGVASGSADGTGLALQGAPSADGDDDDGEMAGISVIQSPQGLANLMGALSREDDDFDDYDDDLDDDFDDDEEDC